MTRALRRPSDADVRESNLIHQICLQTKMAEKSGQVPEEISQAILDIMARVHTHLLIRTGIVDRNRQRKYNARHGGIFNIMNPFDAVFAGIAILLLGAWFLI